MMIVQKVEIKRQESATTVILLQGICKLESPHFLLIVELLCIHMVSKKPCFFRKGKKLVITYNASQYDENENA